MISQGFSGKKKKKFNNHKNIVFQHKNRLRFDTFTFNCMHIDEDSVTEIQI